MLDCSDGLFPESAPSPPRRVSSLPSAPTPIPAEPLGVTLGRFAALLAKFQDDYRRGYEDQARRLGLSARP